MQRITLAPEEHATGRSQVSRDALVVAEFCDRPEWFVEPGALLELKTQSGQLFLEYPAALDVVGDDRPRGAVDEQQHGAVCGGQILTQVAPGSELGHRVGTPQYHPVLLVGVQKLTDTLMFQLDIFAASLQLATLVVGCRVGHDWQSVVRRSIRGRDQHRIELSRQIDLSGNGRDHARRMKLGRHRAASVKRRPSSPPSVWRPNTHANRPSIKGLRIGCPYRSRLSPRIQGSGRPDFQVS